MICWVFTAVASNLSFPLDGICNWKRQKSLAKVVCLTAFDHFPFILTVTAHGEPGVRCEAVTSESREERVSRSPPGQPAHWAPLSPACSHEPWPQSICISQNVQSYLHQTDTNKLKERHWLFHLLCYTHLPHNLSYKNTIVTLLELTQLTFVFLGWSLSFRFTCQPFVHNLGIEQKQAPAA